MTYGAAFPGQEPLPLNLGSFYDDGPAVQGADIQERFESFHALNPWVLEALERLTLDWLSNGNTHASIGMFTEHLRWVYGRSTRGDKFKLNNSYRSRYVRKLCEMHPEWADVFSQRTLTSA